MLELIRLWRQDGGDGSSIGEVGGERRIGVLDLKLSISDSKAGQAMVETAASGLIAKRWWKLCVRRAEGARIGTERSRQSHWLRCRCGLSLN